MGSRDLLGRQTIFKDARLLRVLLNQGALPPGSTAGEWANIILIRSTGTSSVYPVTTAGRDAALAAGSSGDMVWVPPCTLTGDFTIPEGIGVASMGNKTYFAGQVTLEPDTFLLSIIVLKTYNQAGTAYGVIGPASGTAYLDDTAVKITNTGAGDVHAVAVSAGGDIEIWGCDIWGNASGAGDGYGVVQSSGNAYIEDAGRVRGSTATFSGTVQGFAFDNEIKLLDAAGALLRLYPATDAGLTAALAGAGSGDTVQLPSLTITGGPWTVSSGEILKGHGDGSKLVGNITNTGTLDSIEVTGNVTNTDPGLIIFSKVIVSTGTGITNTGYVFYSRVTNNSGCTWGIDTTDGRIFMSTIGSDTVGPGIKVNGANAQVVSVRSLGAPGAQVETCERVENCSFKGSTNNHGLLHTTGTATIRNTACYTFGGTGYGVNLTAGNITMAGCTYDTVNGITNTTYGRGDRGAYDVESWHGRDIEASTLTRHHTQPTSSAADAGKPDVLSSDGSEWILGETIVDTSKFPDDPYTTNLALDGYPTAKTNPQRNRYHALASMPLAGTTYQAFLYWNTDGELVIGTSEIDSAWTFYTLDGAGGRPDVDLAGSDNHFTCTLGIDEAGYIHLCYNHHNTALKYRVSSQTIAAFDGTFGSEGSMLGTNETGVTYPTFINDPSDNLYFMFRDGAAGNGDTYFYKYTQGSTTWASAAGLTAGKLIDGKGTTHSAYHDYPAFDSTFGSGGWFHLAWHWRDLSPEKNHDRNYVKWDGTNWKQSDGSAQTIPITTANEDTYDAVSTDNGLTSFNMVAADSDGCPHTAYSKIDADGFRHIYHSYYNGTSWITSQVTKTETPNASPATDYDVGLKPIMVIDSTDRVHIIYLDNYSDEGILIMRSDAGNYTIWERLVIYPRYTGFWGLKLDNRQWREDNELYMPIEYWLSGEDRLPIRLLKWVPDAFDPTEQVNKNLRAGEINTLWEPLSDGAASPALIFGGGDVIMCEVT